MKKMNQKKEDFFGYAWTGNVWKSIFTQPALISKGKKKGQYWVMGYNGKRWAAEPDAIRPREGKSLFTEAEV